jgi:hypothetical protein
MASAVNGSKIPEAMLDAIRANSRNGSVSFSPDDVMKQVVGQLNAASDEDLKRAVLCYFNDLLRTGVVGIGDKESIDPKIRVSFGPTAEWPHGKCYLTPDGKEVLNQASRDPINSPGYLAYLDQEATLDDVTRGYVVEALNTYRACCYKATAVLIGAAVERLVLALRDELRTRLNAIRSKPTKGLDAWQVKTALEAIAKQILPDLSAEARKTGDENVKKLEEDSQARLLPVAAEFRKIRNDAGHPASLTPVNPSDVHCNLLLFPSTARLLQRLKEWVVSYYR